MKIACVIYDSLTISRRTLWNLFLSHCAFCKIQRVEEPFGFFSRFTFRSERFSVPNPYVPALPHYPLW